MSTQERLAKALEALDQEEPEFDETADGFAVSFDSVFLADFARCVTVAECITGSVDTAKHVVIDSFSPVFLDWAKVHSSPAEVDRRTQSATVALALRAKEEQPDLPNEFSEGAHPGRRLEDTPLAAISTLTEIQRAIVAVSFVFGGSQEELCEMVGRKAAAFVKDYKEAVAVLTESLGEAGADPSMLARAFRSRTNRHDVSDDRFLLLSVVKGAEPGDPQSGLYEDRRKSRGFLRR